MCGHTAAADGTACADGRGGCYGGLCNFVPVRAALGSEEVIFDWTTDSCEKTQMDRLDIPDAPARFVRTSSGQIVLFSGNFYLSRGPDFDGLQRVCEPVFQLTEPSGPESYENGEWLWSPYREGETLHVLIHNEFHPLEPPPCNGINCWYNSITHAVSTDDAYSFVKPGAPAHVVAPAPDVWIPPPADFPPAPWYVTGYLNPSSIVLGPGGYYYALFRVVLYLEDWLDGACVMRTKTLDDPASWRAWDGSGFNLAMTSPYVTGTPAEVCTLLQMPTGRVPSIADSLTYNTYLERYVLVGLLQEAWQYGVCGFYFSLSSDLVHWSDIQLLMEASCPSTDKAYPSIVDRNDATTNFERPGRTPQLYYTQYHDYWLDRDLVRVPLTFTVEE
jgi:hypothetical protein